MLDMVVMAHSPLALIIMSFQKNSAMYLSAPIGSHVTGGETLYRSGNIFFLKASTDMVLTCGKGQI